MTNRLHDGNSVTDRPDEQRDHHRDEPELQITFSECETTEKVTVRSDVEGRRGKARAMLSWVSARGTQLRMN